MSGKRVRHTRSSGRGVLTVVAVAAVVALLGWWVTQLVAGGDEALPVADSSDSQSASDSQSPDSGGDQEDADQDDADQDAEAEGAATTDDAADEAVDTCVGELADVEAAVASARPGVRSWQDHVRARTDMLADRISEARMEAIYERTMHKGHAAQERFAAALSDVAAPEPCGALAEVEDGSDARVGDCTTRSQAAGKALVAAESTMEEWQSHLRHMAEYADGGMRTGKAMALWVKAWRQAPEGIAAYGDGRADLAAAPACSTG